MATMQLKSMVVSLLLVAGASASVWGQVKNVNKAEDDLKNGKLDEAKTLIDEAATNEKTADKAKTWYLKGQIYAAIGADSTGKFKALAPDANDQAFAAFQKCLQIESKYAPMVLTNFRDLGNLYAQYWHVGADAFNNKDYKTSLGAFKKVKEVNDYMASLDMGMGNAMDTMAILNIGNSAYNLGEKDTAARYYQMLADIKYTEQSFVYKVLLAQYRATNNEEKYMATLEEAKALFPDDKDFANEEISYYNEKGETGKLLGKLEEAVSKDPNDYNSILNLAITYDNMANPKDDSGQTQDLPANHDELFNKAIEYYNKAIALKPDDYAANFNLGLMYYNGAAHVGKQLGQLSSSKADQARQDSLLKQQNTMLDQALPPLEKAYQTLEAKPKLDPNELVAYKNAIIGLQGIYARKSQMDKYNDLKAKLDAADTKAQ